MGAAKGQAQVTEETAVVCAHIFNAERPVTVVVHHSDGVWQLVCGGVDLPDVCSNFEVVGLDHLFDRQDNLFEVRDLQRGCMAELEDGRWEITNYDE